MHSEIDQLLPALVSHPRVDLGLQVTPLEPLHRLGEELGVRLFAKRDDVSTLALGGNKVRQLAYYLGPAQEAHADTVLITGAVQSNFVRLCAAAAAKLGWQAIVQLEQRVPETDSLYNSSGNVLLNQILGAQLHYFAEGDNEAAADAQLDAIAETVAANGRKPFVIHLGMDHPPIGALGYAYCAAECFVQSQSNQCMPDHIVIPSGSGLTHAGFQAGARAFGWDVQVHGICVRRDAQQQTQRIMRRLLEMNHLLDFDADPMQSDVRLYDDVLAPGYGQLNDQVMSAITRCAQREAMLLDPVYSGRTMAGLIRLVEQGVIGQGQTVMFIHTGGLPAIFAYQNPLMARLSTFQ